MKGTMQYKELQQTLQQLSFTIGDIGERLTAIAQLHSDLQDEKPEDDLSEEHENWSRCISLLQSEMTVLTQMINAVATTKEKKLQTRSDDDLPRYDLPDYSLIDDYKEDVYECAIEDGSELPLAQWITRFLQEYFYIPQPEIQIPILTAFTLLNSMASPADEKYPKLWIQGSSGTGKSRLSEFIKFFYGGDQSRRVAYCFGTQSSAAGVRNTLDQVGIQNDVPTLFHWENITPSDLLGKIKEAYTLLLANTRAKANKGNMVATKEGGVIEYRTHTLWVMDSTQPWGSQGKEGEVRRRLLIINTEKSDRLYPELSNFSWRALPKKYAEFWTKDQIEKSFYPLLVQAKKLSRQKAFVFKASEYEPYYQLIATGIHCGVWDGFDQALKCCKDHYDLNRVDTVDGSPLKIIVEKIIQDLVSEHRYWIKRNNGADPELAPAHSNALAIAVSHGSYNLKQKILDARGSVTQYEMEGKVHEVMRDLGYTYEIDVQLRQQWFKKKSLD